jgi:hypothetical protein
MEIVRCFMRPSSSNDASWRKVKSNLECGLEALSEDSERQELRLHLPTAPDFREPYVSYFIPNPHHEVLNYLR